MLKVKKKAIVHHIGELNSTLPLYIVKSQLNNFTPVGMEIIMVAIPKKALTLAPAPMVKK
jgi:hypothetical protein